MFEGTEFRHTADQPDKAPQQRVNVRHVIDPYSKGNTRGGPSSVIHKHSRAVAFSVFRTHSLFSSSSRRTTTHMNTSVSILLATKKVQEQYTSTRTTAKLNSHGLLEDRPVGGNEPSATVFSPTATAASPSIRAVSRSSSTQGRRDRSTTRDKGKGPEQDANASGVGTSSQTASGWSVHSSSGASSTISPSRSPAPPSVPSSPSMRQPSTHIPAMSVSSTSTSETAKPSDRATSIDSSKPSGSYSMSSSTSETIHEQASSSRTQFSEDIGDDTMDLDDEQSPPRTSHAEAFATMDSNYLEYMRRDQRPTHQDESSHSLLGGIFKKMRPQNAVKLRSGPHPAGPSATSLEGRYDPPWMTMAPRSKVEERERVIQNLNDSFKDVGLLPSFRAQRGHQEKHKRGKTSSSTNIFANVPVDCLYMLLPLWPGETDTTAAEQREDPSGYIVPVEERQYLLVYYVPFDERSKKKRDKKRTREEVHKGSSSASGAHGTNISLQAFRICARLVSYSDMRETGVRLPDYGMSITGSMTEATRHLPSSSIRDSALDDIVIGVCHTREGGMEFLPEGLAKLGLCMPRDRPIRLPVREDEEAEESEEYLTPIGRAAVEMAWLGSMAVTCFGPS